MGPVTVVLSKWGTASTAGMFWGHGSYTTVSSPDSRRVILILTKLHGRSLKPLRVA